MYKLHKKKAGFTLVELLVVIAIIAILAAVVMPKLLGYTDRAREARAMADIGAMKTVVEVYAADDGHGKYPAEEGQVVEGVEDILAVLNDKGIGDGTNLPEDPWGKAYTYANPFPAENESYIIVSAGADGDFNTEDDIFTTDEHQPDKGASGYTESGV